MENSLLGRGKGRRTLVERGVAGGASRAWGLVLAAIWFLVAVGCFPLRTAFVFGADESFEFTKGRLYSDGHTLYGEVWNDQPPLHTMLLGAIFRWVGPSAFAGRLLTVVFAAGLVAAFFALVHRWEGPGAALGAVGLLFLLPPFLSLSLSCMLEVPAFALGLMAAWCWVRAGERAGLGWFAVSGMLTGAALMTKLTSALLLPALWWQAWAGRGEGWGGGRKPAIRGFVVWLGGCAVVVGGLRALHPAMTMEQLLGVHFARKTQEIGAANSGTRFSWLVFWMLGYAVVPALLGVGLRWARGRLSSVRLPLGWLVTMTLAHEVNRPYWSFYQVHFAFPLAWLAAVGVKELVGLVHSSMRMTDRDQGWVRLLGWTAVLAGTLALLTVHGGWALVNQVSDLRSRSLVEETHLVSTLASYGDRVHWAYADEPLYVFHAGYKVPPELGVISFKRRHGAGFTRADLLAWLKRYRPEALVLRPYEHYDADWQAFLAGYQIVDADDRMALFVSRRLLEADTDVSASPAGREDVAKGAGLRRP